MKKDSSRIDEELFLDLIILRESIIILNIDRTGLSAFYALLNQMVYKLDKVLCN